MNKAIMRIFAVSLLSLSGCDAGDEAQPGRSGIPGSERDEHGCIGSAGYQWCEATGQCERPWELAAKEGFDNTKENFRDYCDPGG